MTILWIYYLICGLWFLPVKLEKCDEDYIIAHSNRKSINRKKQIVDLVRKDNKFHR